MSEKKKKLPWYPLYARDFNLDEKVQSMTNEQAGMYIKLLNHQWIEGSIPANYASLSFLKLGGPGVDINKELESLNWVVTHCFTKRDKKKLRFYNTRLEQVRQGKTKPAKQVFAEMRKKYNLPKKRP